MSIFVNGQGSESIFPERPQWFVRMNIRTIDGFRSDNVHLPGKGGPFGPPFIFDFRGKSLRIVIVTV